MFLRKVVLVSWRCNAFKRRGFKGRFNRVVSASLEAVMNGKLGWVCDCGRWVIGNDCFHTVLENGERFVYVRG